MSLIAQVNGRKLWFALSFRIFINAEWLERS